VIQHPPLPGGANHIDIPLEMHNKHDQQTNQQTNNCLHLFSELNLSLPHLEGNDLASHELTMNASDLQRFANSLTRGTWKCRLHFTSVVWYDDVLVLGFELFQRIAQQKKFIAQQREVDEG
jgi:hypothetical protein